MSNQMKEIDWSKAPEWANVVICADLGAHFWAPSWGGQKTVENIQTGATQYATMSGDHCWKLVASRHEPVWSGEGLPPVGTVCEWLQGSQHQWERIEILAYHGGETWIRQEGKPSIIVGNIANLRPLRTPEAIAAEERSKAISQIIHAIGWSLSMPGAADAAARIYDAGWRLVTP